MYYYMSICSALWIPYFCFVMGLIFFHSRRWPKGHTNWACAGEDLRCQIWNWYAWSIEETFFCWGRKQRSCAYLIRSFVVGTLQLCQETLNMYSRINLECLLSWICKNLLYSLKTLNDVYHVNLFILWRPPKKYEPAPEANCICYVTSRIGWLSCVLDWLPRHTQERLCHHMLTPLLAALCLPTGCRCALSAAESLSAWFTGSPILPSETGVGWFVFIFLWSWSWRLKVGLSFCSRN